MVVTVAPAGTAGAAGGLVNAVRQLGAAIGVAAVGAFTAVGPGGAPARGLLVAAAVCALALLAPVIGGRVPGRGGATTR